MANKKAWQEAAYVYAEQTRECPHCESKPGEQCRNALGRWRRNPHKDRIEDLGDPRLIGIYDLIRRVEDESLTIGAGDWSIVKSVLLRYSTALAAEKTGT